MGWASPVVKAQVPVVKNMVIGRTSGRGALLGLADGGSEHRPRPFEHHSGCVVEEYISIIKAKIWSQGSALSCQRSSGGRISIRRQESMSGRDAAVRQAALWQSAAATRSGLGI